MNNDAIKSANRKALPKFILLTLIFNTGSCRLLLCA